MHELSLIILTVCIESAVGIMILLTVNRLLNKNIDGVKATLLAAILVGIGLISGTTHLGRPLRAMNSLLNLHSSWLSWESLLMGIFGALCALCLVVGSWDGLLKTARSGSALLRRGDNIVAAIRPGLVWVELLTACVGIFLLFAMGSLYASTSVPAWTSLNTYIEKYASAALLGSILFSAAIYTRRNKRNANLLRLTAMVGLIVLIISSELHMAGLVNGGAAAARSADILRQSIMLTTAKWGFFIIGMMIFHHSGVINPPELRVEPSSAHAAAAPAPGHALAWFAAMVVFVGALAGRTLFYSSMVVMNVGM